MFHLLNFILYAYLETCSTSCHCCNISNNNIEITRNHGKLQFDTNNIDLIDKMA